MTKRIRLSAWEKVFVTLMSGEPVTKDYFNSTLGNLSYKISSYILEIKIQSKAIIRVAKDGRKVVSYQLVNPAEVMQYWTDRGITLDQITSLKDLNAEPAVVEDYSVESETA
jgi:hypothetical protein